VQKDKCNSPGAKAQWSQFEKLLQEISSRFISLPVSQIDSVMEDTQRRICETLGFDLSTLWQPSAREHNVMELTHLYSPPDGPQPIEKLDASVTFPWVYTQMLAGKPLAYSNDQLGEEASIDKASRIFYGVKSSANLPLMVEGNLLIGIISFDTIRHYRQFKDDEVTRLKLVAEVFTNALVRKRTEKRLIESENRLRLAASSADVGIWELDVARGMFWATEKALSIFGWDPGENISLERFENSVHADDLDPVRQAIARSIEQKTQLCVEYRIFKEGSMRWIQSNGYPYFHSSGEPDRILGVSIDISDRKMFETLRNKEKERLASAIDIAALGFYETAEEMRIDFLDDRMRDFIGITAKDDAVARDFWLQHIHPEDLSYVKGIIRNVLVEGVDRFELFYRYLHPVRGLTWLRHLSRVLKRNENGRATRVIGVMQDITARKVAEEKLRESEKILKFNQRDLRKLAGQLIAVKEDELRRLSRELHDDLTQRLAVLAIDAGKLEIEMNDVGRNCAEYQGKVVQIKDQLIRISDDVHRISRQLHPTILDDLGLLRAIESECEAMMLRDGLAVNFRQDNIPDLISKNLSLCIYRIIQEGLTNVIRHAGVKACDVRLGSTHDMIHLEIQDKGRGFDLETVRDKPGLGLSSMRERVQFVRGNFSIESQRQQGTTIRVQIPLNGGTDEAS